MGCFLSIEPRESGRFECLGKVFLLLNGYESWSSSQFSSRCGEENLGLFCVWFPLLEGYENHLASTQPQFEYEVIYRILVCLLLFEQQRIFFLRKKTKFCWVGGWSICLQLNNNVYTRRTGTTTDRSASRQLVWSSFPPLNTCIPFSGTTKVF